MNQEERDLIQGLFDRLRDNANQGRDPEAERFIAEQIRYQPSAPYYMAQAIIVQEQAIQEQQSRIAELEERVRQLEAPPQRSQGGFLANRTGGMFGRGEPPPPRQESAVPATSGPWGRTSTAQPPAAQPYAQGSQSYQQPQQQYGQPAPAQQPARSGGGFLKGALATAAGVAGGAILYDQMKGMFGGGSGAAHASSGQGSEQDIQNRVDQALDQAQDEELAEDAAADDQQDYDMSSDDGGDIET